MADRWERMPWDDGGLWLIRDGRSIANVQPAVSSPGQWAAWVYDPEIFFAFFPTRSAAVHAVMVETQSNKRCR